MNKIKKELRKYKHAWPLLYVFIYMPWFILLETLIPADYPQWEQNSTANPPEKHRK